MTPAEKCQHSNHGYVCYEPAYLKRLDEQAKRIEESQTDAARYRWLRANFLRDVQHRLTWYLPMNTPMTAEGLDKNIDAALAKVGVI